MNLTPEIISKATGSTIEDAKKFKPYLNKYLRKYNIDTPTRIMAFLSQIGVESAQLKRTREYGDGSKYEGKTTLGNIYQGDGKKFLGRGLIQITGRTNYQGVQDNFGWNVIDNPDILEEPDKATEVSAWWWANRKKDGKYLSEWADEINPNDSILDGKNYQIFEKITRGINGGTLGLEQRAKNYSRVEDKYSEIKQMAKIWFTKWWGMSIVAIMVIGGGIVLYKQFKNK